MSKRSNQDVKRQLFKGLVGRKSSNLDTATSNLLSRTLRKNSDKYINQTQDDPEFVIHKSTSPEDYKIFSTQHPIRESKLQALEQSEQAFNEVFHSGSEDSGSEDEEPDVSTLGSTSQMYEDDILISVPGYSREELTASKRLNLNDRRNVRLSKVSSLERAFSNTDFLKGLNPDRLEDYDLMNQEFLEHLAVLKEDKQRAKELPLIPKSDDDTSEPYNLEFFREAVAKLEDDAWMHHNTRAHIE